MPFPDNVSPGKGKTEMELIKQWSTVWEDPVMRHAMLVHFPIVISCLLIPLSLGAAGWMGRGRGGLAGGCLIGCGLLIISAFVAKNAGAAAHTAVDGSTDQHVAEMVHQHGAAAVRVWWLALAAGGVLLTSLFGRPVWQYTIRWLFFLLVLILAGYVAWVADLGGHLVYGEGVGMSQAPIERALAAAEQAARPQQDPRAAFFLRHVRPILSVHCWQCHTSSGDESPAGKLDLTTIAGLLRGGQSGPVIVVGRPGVSRLIQAVRWEIADLHMPAEKPQLPADDIDVLVAWVRQGVVWQGE